MDSTDIVAILSICVISIALVVIGLTMGEGSMQQQAIEQKCAQYNPVTAEFEWIKKEKK